MPEPRDRGLSATLAPEPAAPAARRSGRLAAAPAWAWGLALAIPLGIVYVLVAPPSADLAAAAYRSDLFARLGFTIWDTGWYDGHSLPSYSLLSPALGAWIGLRELLALSAALGTAMFGLVAARAFRAGAARAATLAFAFGFCCELGSGRVPYDLGAAIALASLAAFARVPRGRGRMPLALALAVLAAVASPVAGAFLGLASLAWALASLAATRAQATETDDRLGNERLGPTTARREPAAARRDAIAGLALCAASLLPILLLALAFPEGGYEPFAGGAFWPQLAVAVAVAVLLPRGQLSEHGWRVARVGAALYAISLFAAWAIQTPLGSNATRLGELIGPPLVVGTLWDLHRVELHSGLPRWARQRFARSPPQTGDGRRRQRALSGRRALLLLAPLLLYWQLATSVDDQVALAGDPTVQASFYAPLRAELDKIARRGPIRVEVPLTGAHWESVYLPGHGVSIARGWDRQLDTRYAALFYRPTLTAAAYRAWLDGNAVAYVALPDARLSIAGEAEARLVRDGLPYLREVWSSRRWRLFAVRHATPLAQSPAKLLALGSDSFAIAAPRAGSYEVRVRWTSYWAPASPGTCVAKAPGGFTEVRARSAGTVRVNVAFALSRVFTEGPRC